MRLKIELSVALSQPCPGSKPWHGYKTTNHKPYNPEFEKEIVIEMFEEMKVFISEIERFLKSK